MADALRSLATRWAPAAGGVILAAFVVATQFPAAGNDDSHITFWVAHALAKHGAVVNYDGFPVEQTSSLSLAFVLSLAERIGLSIPSAAWVFGLLCAAASVALSSGPERELEGPRAIFAPVLVASSLPFLYWSTSGMEGTFMAALGLLVAFAAGRLIDAERAPRARELVGTGLLALGFALARPEAPIELCSMAAAAAALSMLRALSDEGAGRFRHTVRALVAVGASVVLSLGIALARTLAFGVPVPNPAAVKTHAFALEPGVAYLVNVFTLSSPYLPIVALAGAVLVVRGGIARRMSSWLAMVLGFCVAALSFVVVSGGDWMPCARLLVPAVPGLAILAAEALGTLALRSRLLASMIGVGLVAHGTSRAVAFGSSPQNGSYRAEEAHAGAALFPHAAGYAFAELANRAHRRDARLLERLMPIARSARPTRERPITLMSGQAGMVPYYVFREFYGSARFIDLYALTDPRPLDCLPERARAFQLQGAWLSPAYIIDHADELSEDCGLGRPDIVFSTGRFPRYLAKRGYRKVYQGPRGMEAFIAVDEDRFGEAPPR